MVIQHNENLLLRKGVGCKIRATIFCWKLQNLHHSISDVIVCSSLQCLILLILVLLKKQGNYVNTNHYDVLLWNLFQRALKWSRGNFFMFFFFFVWGTTWCKSSKFKIKLHVFIFSLFLFLSFSLLLTLALLQVISLTINVITGVFLLSLVE